MANGEKIGFVDRRSGVRGTRADRRHKGRFRLVGTKVMRFDDWMHGHTWVAVVLIFVGIVSVVTQ